MELAYSLNFEELEKDAGFRSEVLYFIRLCNPYLKGIFWDAFPRNNINRRKELYKIATENLKNPNQKPLLDAIVPNKENHGKRESVNVDFISGDFSKEILDKLPEDICKHFQEISLSYNHGLFIKVRDDLGRADNFTLFKIVEILKSRRHFLEHYGEKEFTNSGKPKKNKTEKIIEKRRAGEFYHSDHNFVKALSFFILPELMHHFAGRVAYYERKLGTPIAHSNAAIIREIVRAQIAERRANNKLLFGQERSKKQMKDKGRRKKIVSDDIEWRRAYLENAKHQGRQTDYRQHEFKLRYYFVGKHNINAIKRLFEFDSEKPFHFKRDIEAFYILCAKINFLIHLAFEHFPMDEYKKPIGKDYEETKIISLIRNTIAHNGLFWNVKNDDEIIPIKTIFKLVMKYLSKPPANELANQFYDRVAQFLKDENFDYVDIDADKENNIPPKALLISHWTKENRQKYILSSNEKMKIDKRKNYKKEIARIMRQLNQARKEIRLEFG